MVTVRKKIAGLSPATLERFVLRVRRAVRIRGIVNVFVGGNRELRSLNRRFRGKDKATDVLSFPAPEDSPAAARMAGEIAISAEIAAANAKQLGHSLPEEIKILALHGILHLAGYDHERDNGEMERREIRLRGKFGLKAGLIERAHRLVPLRRESA